MPVIRNNKKHLLRAFKLFKVAENCPFVCREYCEDDAYFPFTVESGVVG